MNRPIPLFEVNTLTGIPDLNRYVKKQVIQPSLDDRAKVLFITSYPPRECGIATYSQDLIKSLSKKFSDSFSLEVCALEDGASDYIYPKEVTYTLDTTNANQFELLAREINKSDRFDSVIIQHEFGFFRTSGDSTFLAFLFMIKKPILLVFHTVLPNPTETLKKHVRAIVSAAQSVIVMTRHSADVLKDHYGITPSKVVVIPHGTHLVPHLSKEVLKEKYHFQNRKVLSTFGLLSSGKGIETTLDALPEIIQQHPDVLFLILGKTHPGVVAEEGEAYRTFLQDRIQQLALQEHVLFINQYLPLEDLLEYLQLTDIYLFTSRDKYQAVSGTFSYAMSCACPIISTAIPHACEVLHDDTGILINFQDSDQLAAGVNRLFGDASLMTSFSTNALQRIVPSAWENSALAHAKLLLELSQPQHHFQQYKPLNSSANALLSGGSLRFCLPEINMSHIRKMTSDFGMFQFSKINQPDHESGYTLDDNARALIAVCMQYAITKEAADLQLISIYLKFVLYCLQPDGYLLNYVDVEHQFTDQNQEVNLADANGRAIWALGFVASQKDNLPSEMMDQVREAFNKVVPNIEKIHSTRAMAFTIKGLYYYNQTEQLPAVDRIISTLAHRLVQMYQHESDDQWQWFESYLTYANSLLPEALLFAWLATGENAFKRVAITSFDFLLSRTFTVDSIQVISNKNWLHRGQEPGPPGQQPIDVAYTILALKAFYDAFDDESYHNKMVIAFNWFLGANFLNQIIYNPCTGGCYDGLEATQVNLNQGAESTVCYLMARLTME
jgi:glycosyltransferase involved in cell wall biosynthesis